MTGRCATCRHWGINDHGDGRWFTNPDDPDTCLPMAMPFQVKTCLHPALLFCERPLERNGFAVSDGSGYMAYFMTAEDFGCVRHEPTDE